MKEWTEKQYLLIMIQPFQTIAIVPNINGQESSQFMCYPAKAGDISGLLIAIHTALDRMHKGHLSPFHSQHGNHVSKSSFGSIVQGPLEFRFSD